VKQRVSLRITLLFQHTLLAGREEGQDGKFERASGSAESNGNRTQ